MRYSLLGAVEENGKAVTNKTAYIYDALGQLSQEITNAEFDDEGKVIGGNRYGYQYDGYGNIIKKGVCDEDGNFTGSVVNYGYDGTWKDKLTSYNGQSITYDTNGNPTSYLGTSATWEKSRQLKAFGNIEYTYNANGIRTSKKVNGEIFFDPYGEFSRIRENLVCMPEDIKLKRLAGNLLMMAQSGQYNFMRCMKHGEPEAAQLACVEYVSAAMKTTFLLQDRYMPYYKWSFRALRELIGTEELSEKLSFLLFGDNRDDTVAGKKYDVIEEIASETITRLQDRNLTEAICGDLEKHAYSVNDKIADSTVRNMNILIAVGE